MEVTRPRQGRKPSKVESELGGGFVSSLPSSAGVTCPIATVVDLFCGAGALSHGFLQEGFAIACGYDLNEACRYPFEENNRARFVRRNVTEIDPREIDARFAPELPKVLIGCAPCQPYSRYSRGRSDPKWLLLAEFARLAVAVAPDIVTMENVPQLVRFNGGKTYREFVTTLERAGYAVQRKIVNCADFGVPQSRSRLVVICSKHGEPQLPEPTHAPRDHTTVGDVIGSLPALDAGCADAADPLHRASIMAPLNLRRIRASRPGGTWRDWPFELVAECHRKSTGKRYFAVYGRMRWDQQAPTITTKFIGFGNGRFGHPEQDRALSLREGALLQTFPPDYAFVRPGDRVYITRVSRMIGNAVPVQMARAVARAIKKHIGRSR
jgi:DNA (cytosine-5)-methyltransferase 1